MTDIYISYEWRIVLCAIFMLHIRLLYRTTAEKVKGVHRMRVEQQSQNIIDVVKQSIGPEEKSGAVLSQYTTGAAGAAVEKSSVSDNAKSVNLKDAIRTALCRLLLRVSRSAIRRLLTRAMCHRFF